MQPYDFRNRLRIAQVAPLHVAVPPEKYGGTERVIALLTDGLVQVGHDVTLFATGDSQTEARLVPVVPHGLRFDEPNQVFAAHITLLTEVYQRRREFDIIHSHLEALTLPFATQAGPPTVLTFHSRLDLPEVVQMLREYPYANCVSISDSQREPVPDINWVATVNHGIEVDSFPFRPDPGDYLAFVGRIAPEKGPEHAIEIARRAGVPLKIAAKVDTKDRDYFEQRVKPLLCDPLVEFLGMVDEDGKRDLMSHALALLLPLEWPEPFGMVFIEALACGTPVLTRPRGSAPELVTDGTTGFVRETDDELADAVRALPGISRRACREYAEEYCSTRRMTCGYVEVYRTLIGAARATA